MLKLITLLGSVSVLALLVTLLTCALCLRRRAIRRGLSWAETLSPGWAWLQTELSAWSPAAGGGSSAPNLRHSRTSRVWRALLVLAWVAAISPSSAFSPLSADLDLVYAQSPVRLATNDTAASTQAEVPSVYTDEAGRYRFEGVPKGIHKVTIDLSTLPPHLRPPEGEVPPALWLTPGMEQTSEAVSTGVRFTAAYDQASGDISGLVFLDLDGDGQPGPNDPGLPNVRVIDPIVHQYYVPFNDANLWTLFDDKDTGLPGAQQCHSAGTPVAGTLESSVFLVASADGTTYYYDHWEDGYDADPLVPGASTEVGTLDAGEVELFQSSIDPAQVGSVLYHDGRDRITVAGLGVSVVRMVFPETPGVLLAGAWEVSEVSDWGTSYVATVGEDLDFNPGGVDDHDFTGLQVMAALPGTEVYYRGALVGPPLGPGGTWFRDGANDGPDGGGVDSNDTITATAPIQVQMLSGGCGNEYSGNGYTLQPMTGWGNEYWAPVPGFSCRANIADSDIYLHNQNGGPIDITAVSDQGTVVVPIPAHTTISLLDYVTNTYGWEDISTENSGIHLFSADPFLALALVDSASNGLSESQDYDWGYNLVPVSELSSQVVVGYAPGNNATPPTDNGNSAFVVAVTDTVIHVDLDQDGTPDAFDMNGDGDAADDNVFAVDAWDEPASAGGIPLLAGQTTRVGDPNDHNLQGALIYSSDYADRIAVAWGQDPCQANYTAPYLDLGYTVLPLTIPSVSKEDALAIEADDGCIGVSPGDTLTYTISLVNNGLGSMNDATLIDSLPYTYTDFVVGSLQVTMPPAHDPFEYSNDGVNFGAPENADIQAFRIQWPTMGPMQVVTITFRVTLYTDMPTTVTEITNQAEVDSANTDPVLSEDPDDPFDPDTDTTIRHCAAEPTPTPTSTPSEPPTPEPPEKETPESEPPTLTITPTPYTTITPTPYIPTPSAPVTPTLTVEALTVDRLPETGGLPGWFTVVLGVSILIGATGLLSLALLEMRGRRGDGKRG